MQSNPALFVRCMKRRYELAKPEEILVAAQQIVDARMQRGASFTDPAAACDFFRDKLAGQEREVFAVVLLDTRHRLIDCVELFFGTIDGAEVYRLINVARSGSDGAEPHPDAVTSTPATG